MAKTKEQTSTDKPRKPRTRSHVWLMVSLLTVVAVVIAGFILHQIITKSGDIVKDHQVAISAEYYEDEGKPIKSDPKLINDAIEAKKSFVVTVSYPICSNETAEFKEYVREFQEKNGISFYAITTDDVQETIIDDVVNYYPTVVIFENGEIVDYLHFDSDEDKPYYKSLEGFSKWFYSNVKK